MAKARLVSDNPRNNDRPGWHATHGTYIAGQAAVDELDIVAREMETKWGCDRLRLLVSTDLREKFDRQRYLVNQAIWHGDLEDVRTQTKRMITAWRALDRQAEAAGANACSPEVWEVTLSDGSVAAVVRDAGSAKAVSAEGRQVRVYDLEEIGRLLTAFPELVKAKAAFPGATVCHVRRNIGDPLDAIDDTSTPIDDPMPF